LSSLVARRQILVEFGHCDPGGLIQVARIFQYFDTSTWLLFEQALGVRQRDFLETIGVLPLVEVSADVRVPLRFGDTIEIASRIAEFRRSSFHVEHVITKNGELAVAGGETRVWAARPQDDTGKIRPAAIPAEIIARFG
jgi:4-hydroxybenzoyl-CoA thioesterase